MKQKMIFFLAAMTIVFAACKDKNEPSSGTSSDSDSRGSSQTSIEGVLAGKFSVSATTQVQFSQGNLQYQASTHTWRFAENQYDLIGSANSNIAADYSGWIDLFGWGTGSNPTQASTNNSDYSTFTDWGVNPISNGGNQAKLWRTLTKDEWVYLFNTRTNASSKYGVASVNGVNGLVILPDSWVLPSGCSFEAGVAASWGAEYFASVNTYTTAQWSQMESAGAVFLPAAGYRDGTSVSIVGSGGGYWSATPYGTSGVYYVGFNSSGLGPQNGSGRYGGQSVRLVR